MEYLSLQTFTGKLGPSIAPGLLYPIPKLQPPSFKNATLCLAGAVRPLCMLDVVDCFSFAFPPLNFP